MCGQRPPVAGSTRPSKSLVRMLLGHEDGCGDVQISGGISSGYVPLLSDAAANIAAALLADWFRMDLFLGHPQLELRVNEITYPSHILDDAPARHRRDAAIYTH